MPAANKFVLGAGAWMMASVVAANVAPPTADNLQVVDTMSVEKTAAEIVAEMSLEDKIAQKIIMSFRYWCADDDADCHDGFTEINPTVESVINTTKIGGVILFANNLPDLVKTTTLIHDLQGAVNDDQYLGLFMAIDQEGGNVERLPRDLATNLPGNMALGAAYLGLQAEGHERVSSIAFEEGQVLGAEITAAGFNFNMAPVVDVQTNPLNPVINVRSYGEDPLLVGTLGNEVADGMASENVIASMKHFPGHGDTDSDSHYGLPQVHKSAEEARAIDLAPYQTAIDSELPPDMIMTAHIQYPSLDDSVITTRDGSEMIKPATLSRKIQHDILRGEMGFKGLTITDALDMQGIADYFDEADAVIKTFQAEVDIALMPTQFKVSKDAGQVQEIINAVADAVRDGRISIDEVNQSVERIIDTKLRRKVLNDNGKVTLAEKLARVESVVGSPEHREIENFITEHAVTMVKNDINLPMTPAQLGTIHMLTPETAQAVALQMGFIDNGINEADITYTNFTHTTWDVEKVKIANADTIIVGSMSSGVSPVEKNGDPNVPVEGADTGAAIPNGQFARFALELATELGKNAILISMRAPYDIALYDDVAGAALATYNYFGFDEYLFGRPMYKVPSIITGSLVASGKLPVTVQEVNDDGSLGAVMYNYGHSA